MATSVLIVDDDERFRGAATELLADRGYYVVGSAATADNAFDLVALLRPDAVLLDVHLPDEDGIALAARLSATAGPLKVLLTSTDGQAVPQRLLTQGRASGFVAKVDLAAADLDHYLKP